MPLASSGYLCYICSIVKSSYGRLNVEVYALYTAVSGFLCFVLFFRPIPARVAVCCSSSSYTRSPGAVGSRAPVHCSITRPLQLCCGQCRHLCSLVLVVVGPASVRSKGGTVLTLVLGLCMIPGTIHVNNNNNNNHVRAMADTIK